MLRLLAVAVVFVVSGCATVPPIPGVAVSPNATIGVLVNIPGPLVHAHVGTTVFNNFEKRYSYDWNLSSFMTARLMDDLTGAGYSVVDLKSVGIMAEDVRGLVVVKENKWVIPPRKRSVLERLIDEVEVEAVVIVQEQPVVADLECTGGPCSSREIQASGLYSRGFLGLVRYKAVAALDIDVISLDPPANLATAEDWNSEWGRRSIALRDFPRPANFENVTEAEMLPVRNAIETYIREVSTRIVQTLRAPGGT